MRMPPNYDFPDMEFITQEDLQQIEIKAKILTLPECYEYLCIDPEDDLTATERKLCKKIWRRGRFEAINKAAEHLFSQMQQRQGGAVAIDYLRQMSDGFGIEVSPKGNSGGFVFNVSMPEDKDS